VSRVDLDLELYAGDPLSFTLPILDSTGAAVTGATTAAGWEVRASARVEYGLAALFTFVPSADATSADGTTSIAAGVVTFYATPTQTLLWAAWPALDVGYDVLVTPPSATPAVGPQTIGVGRIRVHPRYTDPA
jgi:hypothetical protein